MKCCYSQFDVMQKQDISAATIVRECPAYKKISGLRNIGLTFKCASLSYKELGNKAFSIAGPRHWNSFLIEICTTTRIVEFKSRLKTHLFNMAFNGYFKKQYFILDFYKIYYQSFSSEANQSSM